MLSKGNADGYSRAEGIGGFLRSGKPGRGICHNGRRRAVYPAGKGAVPECKDCGSGRAVPGTAKDRAENQKGSDTEALFVRQKSHIRGDDGLESGGNDRNPAEALGDVAVSGGDYGQRLGIPEG